MSYSPSPNDRIVPAIPAYLPSEDASFSTLFAIFLSLERWNSRVSLSTLLSVPALSALDGCENFSIIAFWNRLFPYLRGARVRGPTG